MDLNHIFRTGKYAGHTVRHVYTKDRRYFNWVVENRPEMLKSHKKKNPSTITPHSYKKPEYIEPPEVTEEKKGTMNPLSPNMDFDSQTN